MPEGIDGPGSSSFDLLHDHVRRWIWKQGWAGLRDIQERSIPALLDGSKDLIVSAGTASGKTEAAFLPIVSRIASMERQVGAGFDAVYVSPLRALINDQFNRMPAQTKGCDHLLSGGDFIALLGDGQVSKDDTANRRRQTPQRTIADVRTQLSEQAAAVPEGFVVRAMVLNIKTPGA